MDKNNPIAVLTKNFALRIVKLCKHLREDKKEHVLSKLVLRSGTSIGANIHESIYAQSRADFVSMMSTALKESCETEYWLELLHEAEFIDSKSFESIYNDNCKITATLINIVKEAKEPEK